MVPLPAHSILFKDKGTLGKEKNNLKVKRKHLLLKSTWLLKLQCAEALKDIMHFLKAVIS